MSKIKDLSRQMRELEQLLVSCMKCGMCQAVCPLFEQTHKEADVARGKLALLESLMKEMFDNPHGVNKRLNKCLLCGSCGEHCPSGVKVIEIFIKARAIITGYLKLPFFKKIILRNILGQPAVFDRIVDIGAKLQKLILTTRNPAAQTASLKLLSPLINNRKIIPLANLSFQKSVGKLTNNANTNGPRVAFFTGCLIDKIFPRIGIAAVKSLLYHNVRLVIPQNQACCGIPALAAGDKDTFLTLVKHNLKMFHAADFDYLVTACATCTSTIKKLWPTMVSNEDHTLIDNVAVMAEKTLDISQFLTNVAGLKTLENQNVKSQKIVTYHDPCHLTKSLGIIKEPREVIHAASMYTLKEMTDADTCCGMGGSFNLYHYDISSQIGNKKKENIEATGCHTVATSCPACMMQIADMLSKKRHDIYVKHPIELYAEGI